MPPPEIDWSVAALWRVVATTHRAPCWAAWIVGPGRLHDPAAFTESVLADARERAAELALAASLADRLGIITPPAEPQRVSVVVCTHRRPDQLPALFTALAELDPAPHEILIVDNDPGEQDCAETAARHGARYVREDRRGLDRARIAGTRAASGDVVAFTDDDCLPAGGWLARVDEHFADPTVDALTGPGFAYELETPAQFRFEQDGGFNRGLTERRLDWTTLAPCQGGSAGSGANMMFRRSTLLRLGEVFPPELDAGTPTQTGGDTFALYRVLDAGGRIVYDPAGYVLHRHRRSDDALHRSFQGYGTGVMATMYKLLVQRGEPEAVMLGVWLLTQFARMLGRRLLGRGDPARLQLAFDYVCGAVSGIASWRRAAAECRALDGTYEAARPIAPSPRLASGHPPEQTMSVIIPTLGARSVLERCLSALPRPCDTVEIIVVDDRETEGPWPWRVPEGTQVLRSGGVGAAAARNLGASCARGDLLIFLDDDLVAEPDLLVEHAVAHQGRARAFVVGRSLPRPVCDGYAARAAALWWHDHFRAIQARGRMYPTDLLSGNVSIRRDRFAEIGGFSERFGRQRREDWHFGAALLRARLVPELRFAAVAHHEYVLTSGGRLRAAQMEGRGDALLAHEDPGFAQALASIHPRVRGLPGQVLDAVVARPRNLDAIVALLDALERARLRGLWIAMFTRVQRHAYQHGRRAGDRALGISPADAAGAATAIIDGDGPAELGPHGAFAPDLEVVVDGRPMIAPADLGRPTLIQASRAASLVARAGGLRPELASPSSDEQIALVLGCSIVPADFGQACEQASVVCFVCSPDRVWQEAERVADRGFDVVWVQMDGVELGCETPGRLRAFSDGDAVSVSVATPGRAPMRVLYHRQLTCGRWRTFGDPPVLFGFRPAALTRVGALDIGCAGVDAMAPGLDLFERALKAGQVVAHVELPGTIRQHRRGRPWRGPEWRRQRVRGWLIRRRGGRTAALDGIRAIALIIGAGARGSSSSRARVISLLGFLDGAFSSADVGTGAADG